MDSTILYLLIADSILFIHALFVVFVVTSFILIILGKLCSWNWVRNPWFRLVHLIAIGVVVAQAWLGMICPLTTWEMEWRARAGDAVYSGTFISHWLEILLYYQAPGWLFVVVYTLFALLVVISWIWVRPRSLLNRDTQQR